MTEQEQHLQQTKVAAFQILQDTISQINSVLEAGPESGYRPEHPEHKVDMIRRIATKSKGKVEKLWTEHCRRYPD